MPTASNHDQSHDEQARLLDQVLNDLDPEVLADPDVPDMLLHRVNNSTGAPAGDSDSVGPDGGIADLMGLTAEAPTDLGDTAISPGVQAYDDTLSSERIHSSADLYYLCLHEQLGVFEVVWKLQELFQAGSLRISHGPGAFGLYRFDKHSALRYRRADRLRAYRRVLGSGPETAGTNSRPNDSFRRLMRNFITEVAKFWRDKRVSTVIRDRASDPSFGSIASVRRSGLDLRTNVKNSSYGFVNVLRIETSQALAEAFKILGAEDVRAQFGAETAWDTIELVMWQYFHRTVAASTMNRMATTGRDVLRWLAQPHILRADRHGFEAALYAIADEAEEWISSRAGLQTSRPTPPPRHIYVNGASPAGPRAATSTRLPMRTVG